MNVPSLSLSGLSAMAMFSTGSQCRDPLRTWGTACAEVRLEQTKNFVKCFVLNLQTKIFDSSDTIDILYIILVGDRI